MPSKNPTIPAIGRRHFLRNLGQLAALGTVGLLAACQAAPPAAPGLAGRQADRGAGRVMLFGPA